MRRILFLAAMLIFIFPIAVQARDISRNHSIEIEVECIDEARKIINELNGFNLNSYVGQNHANFTRRVDDWAYRHTQEVLRGLGEVIYEQENAQHLGAEIFGLNTRFAVISTEMERLTLMMAASDTLDVLIAINDRLSNVSRDRDEISGRRNVLLTQASSPIIHISLTQTREDMPPLDPKTFGERVSESFLNSWENTRRVTENLLVFATRFSVPFAIWIAFIVIVMFAATRKEKKRKPKEAKK